MAAVAPPHALIDCRLPAAQTLPWVVCLCADWCGVCRDYRAVFEQLAAQHRQFRFAWLDIEDEADWLGELDVQTFPTVLIADRAGIRFIGPLTPQAASLARLLASLTPDSRASSAAVLPELASLLLRLQSTPACWVGVCPR